MMTINGNWIEETARSTQNRRLSGTVYNIATGPTLFRTNSMPNCNVNDIGFAISPTQTNLP